ncbi:hypothetical protein Paes_1427 [Prosthecochloris aestuarii DSM 271]|uniref:Uncharacterized protein n=1 Tax=Prosthecochloris aestuarii (strain DSM 271 / SK 413) TaxID=290512 RepID=B4S8R1_PROA2|nr:hypothetical protein Paes_1427 [Prosthecochloris aestuarii DSM 271]
MRRVAQIDRDFQDRRLLLCGTLHGLVSVPYIHPVTTEKSLEGKRFLLLLCCIKYRWKCIELFDPIGMNCITVQMSFFN